MYGGGRLQGCALYPNPMSDLKPPLHQPGYGGSALQAIIEYLDRARPGSSLRSGNYRLSSTRFTNERGQKKMLCSWKR